jgi:hypothetical protein
VTAKNLPRLDEDERLGPVIDHLAASFLSGLGAMDYQPSAGEDGAVNVVTADMVDDVARKHFPPCMRNLHERLKRDHHLKHFARLQLGLFLKVGQAFRCPLDREGGRERTITDLRDWVYPWMKLWSFGGVCTVRR